MEQCRRCSGDTKLELDPKIFRSVVPHADPEREYEIGAVLFPVVNAGVSRISKALDSGDVLSRNVETAFGQTSDWNSLQAKPVGIRGEVLSVLSRKPGWICEGREPLYDQFLEELTAYDRH